METNTEILNNLGDYGSAEFTVRKEPLYIGNKLTVDPRRYESTLYDPTQINSHVAIVRDDTNETLSIVGQDYNPLEHPKAFDTAQSVISMSDLNLKGITRKTEVSHDGARAYSTWTLPEHKVNLGKDGDDVALQISSRNSYDGSWSFVVEVGGYRFICLNMQVFANNFAIHKSKHTKGLNLDRIASKLSDAIMFYDKETELWKEMVDTNITNTDAFDILAHLSDAKSAQAHLKQGKAPRSILYEPDVVRNKTLSNLYYYWIHNSQSNSLGSTAWALYNSMTEWATHQKPRNRNSLNNVASLRVDRFEKVRKTLNNKMIPQLKLVA
jgi:hypothetical protein|tara:strand:- start:669 stop:1643 length:975 start_codon:yes stop_codon:yes gene_type:complete